MSSVLISQSGCLALNVPSERLHDPTDAGGILGDWKSDSIGGCHHLAGGYGTGSGLPAGYDGECIDGGSLEVDPFGSAFGSDSTEPKPPEVPWPRFHPVPTRPVFGTPAADVGY
ncbi:hypothetical protein [Rubripirellula reticaptiva]|uniref:hypothetical protein n=1 Tax=Rubripirellula reticaptiva TaxID=2528013 RepID=UPI001FE5876E|nr:hypothetical protein [Rubripirellula reticaptiva]